MRLTPIPIQTRIPQKSVLKQPFRDLSTTRCMSIQALENGFQKASATFTDYIANLRSLCGALDSVQKHQVLETR